MAVKITGSVTQIENSGTTNQSQAITVPNDATICLVFLTGLSAKNKTQILQELSFTAADRTDFTRIGTSYGMSGADYYYQSEAWYFVKPPTGSRTLYWQVKDASCGEGLSIAVVFCKNVDLADPIRDFETVSQAYTTGWTSSLTGVTADDLTFGLLYDYDTTPNADPTGYGQTALVEDLFNHAGIALCYEAGEDAIYFGDTMVYGLPLVVCLKASPVCVQATGNQLSGTGYSLAVAFDSDVAAGNLIVVAFSEYDDAPILSNISDSRGNTWTLNAQASEAAGDGTIFTCIAKDSGPMTVTVTYGVTQYMAMAIAEFSGYTQTEVDEATATVTSTDIHAGSVTGAGLYIGMHEQTATDATITPDANWDATVYNNNGGSNYPSIVLSYREVASGTYDDGWTLSVSHQCGVIGLIFEASASVDSQSRDVVLGFGL